jgi:protein-L-isoaspartate O-methyltransferase
MMVPVGGRKVQRLALVTRSGDRTEIQELLAVRFVPLLEGEGTPEQ